MGVLTTAYAIPAGAFRRLIRSSQRLDALFGYEGELDPTALGLPADWQPDDYGFDKAWEELVIVLRDCGYAKAAALLDDAREVDYDSDWVRYLTPTAVRTVAQVLAPATAAALKETGLAHEVTDYYGKVMAPYMYDYVVGDIEQITAFFRKAGEAGDYILLASA
jgi:hypothetical protein